MTNNRDFTTEIQQYLDEHPGETSLSKIALDLGMTWRTVQKYTQISAPNTPISTSLVSKPVISKPAISASIRTTITTNGTNLLDEIRKIVREEIARSQHVSVGIDESDIQQDDGTSTKIDGPKVVKSEKMPDAEIVKIEKRILELLKGRPEGVNTLKLSGALEMKDADVLVILEKMFNKGTLKITKKVLEPYHTKYATSEA